MVFIGGPYFSYYNLWFEGSSEILENGISVNTVDIDAKLEMMNLGVQLGYQFVIKKHFSIDLILVGPSYSYYKADIGFNAEIDIDKDSDFYKNLQDYIERIAPGLSSVLDKQELTSSGKLDFSYYGFRYLIQFGYRF